jgi:hypothetical protein
MDGNQYGKVTFNALEAWPSTVYSEGSEAVKEAMKYIFIGSGMPTAEEIFVPKVYQGALWESALQPEVVTTYKMKIPYERVQKIMDKPADADVDDDLDDNSVLEPGAPLFQMYSDDHWHYIMHGTRAGKEKTPEPPQIKAILEKLEADAFKAGIELYKSGGNDEDQLEWGCILDFIISDRLGYGSITLTEMECDRRRRSQRQARMLPPPTTSCPTPQQPRQRPTAIRSNSSAKNRGTQEVTQ